ncbi:MAG: hypothetical protein HC794_07850 [Nitrospiraceae bacterium]|nr:hypothetical protein [Nitrospiraceae bacterium]
MFRGENREGFEQKIDSLFALESPRVDERCRVSRLCAVLRSGADRFDVC